MFYIWVCNYCLDKRVLSLLHVHYLLCHLAWGAHLSEYLLTEEVNELLWVQMLRDNEREINWECFIFLSNLLITHPYYKEKCIWRVLELQCFEVETVL